VKGVSIARLFWRDVGPAGFAAYRVGVIWATAFNSTGPPGVGLLEPLGPGEALGDEMGDGEGTDDAVGATETAGADFAVDLDTSPHEVNATRIRKIERFLSTLTSN
jgi:hypothetical protein